MAVIKWFVRAQGRICTTESIAYHMPVTGITEATRPAYVITMTAAVADIMIAVRVVDMVVVKDVVITDMAAAMVVDTIGGKNDV
jgi:hypothetical protein